MRSGTSNERSGSSNEEDQVLPSNQEGFIEVSALRKKRRIAPKNPKLKIGTGLTLHQGLAPPGIAKLFVSLPFPGSRYPLWRMRERVKEHLGEATEFKCKKRLSTRGNTSPFEIYGDAARLEEVLFDEDIWEAKSCLQLVKTNVRLPKDYELPDEDSETDVRAKIKEIKGNSRKRLETRGSLQDSLDL